MNEETKPTVNIEYELDNLANIYGWHHKKCFGHLHHASCPVLRIKQLIDQAIQQEREPIVEDPKTRERIEKILRKFGTTIDPQGVDDGDFETAIDDIIILISK